jgi:hypothetical protein
MDNASNNDTLAKLLPLLIPSFCGMASRGRCFPHIINLLAKVHINMIPYMLAYKLPDFYILLLSNTKEEGNSSSSNQW